MSEATSPNVTQLLVAWCKGDQHAFDALMPEVRKELHRLAAHYMAEEPPGHDLQPTALINEAYLRLVDWKNIQWSDRAHFFGMAANMMRRVLVGYARSRDRFKRGGGGIKVAFTQTAQMPGPRRADVLAGDKAPRELEKIDPRKNQIVEMRFFGGLSQEETAEALNVSLATVRRDWSLARAWLARELNKKGK